MPGFLVTAGVGMTGAATIAAPAAGFATAVVLMKAYEGSTLDRAYNAGVDFLAKYGEPALASATRMVVERHVGAYKAVKALGARLTSSVFGGSTKTNPVQPSIKTSSIAAPSSLGVPQGSSMRTYSRRQQHYLVQ